MLRSDMLASTEPQIASCLETLHLNSLEYLELSEITPLSPHEFILMDCNSNP